MRGRQELLTGSHLGKRDAYWFAALIAVFALGRLAPVVGTSGERWPDTSSYLDLRWWGGKRLPVVPLFYDLMGEGGSTIVVGQALLGIVCWSVAAILISVTFATRGFRVGFMGLFLLLGLTPQVALWDASLLSESLSISFGVLATALAYRIVTDREWHMVVAFGLLVILWLFCRQAHAYVAILSALPFLLAGLMIRPRQRTWLVAASLLILLGSLAAFAGSKNSELQHYSVRQNLCVRMLPDEGRQAWWIDQGLPPLPLEATGLGYDDCMDSLEADDDVRAWIYEEGWDTFRQFVLEHPVFVTEAITDKFTAKGLIIGPTPKRQREFLPEQIGRAVFWPLGIARVVLVGGGWLVVTGLALWLGHNQIGVRRDRVVFGAVLTGLALVQAAIVWVTVTPPLYRQVVLASVQLRIGLMIAIAVYLEAGLTKRFEVRGPPESATKTERSQAGGTS